MKWIIPLILLIFCLCVPAASGSTYLFWGDMYFADNTNLSTLLTDVNNTNYLSESGGIYTMHINFIQNASDIRFTMNDELRLNDVSASFTNVTMDGGIVYGWDNVSDILDDRNTTGLHIGGSSGDITDCSIINSNISYLRSVTFYYINDTAICNNDFDTITDSIAYVTSGTLGNNVSFYNNRYNDASIMLIGGGDGALYTNETITTNNGVITDASGGPNYIFDSCNISATYSAYMMLNGLPGLTIVDNINRSNVYRGDNLFYIKYTTGVEYNTTYSPYDDCKMIDTELVSDEFFNITITQGTLTPTLMSGVTPSRKYVLVYTNGTAIERVESDATGDVVFTAILGVGSYSSVYGFDNFTWSDISTIPSSIYTNETLVTSVTVTDYDGTITTVYANIGGINYTSVNVAGNTWNYTYTPPSTGTKAVLFYAQDNHGYWNSTDPSLSVTVTTPPTPAPTPTLINIIRAPDDVEEKSIVTHTPSPTTPKPVQTENNFLSYPFAWYVLFGAYLGAMLMLNFFGKPIISVFTEGMLYGTISWIVVLLFDKLISIVSSSNSTMFVVFLFAGLAITTIAELLLGEEDNVKRFKNLTNR